MAKRKLKLKWINKYSGDTGFVKAIRESKGYFENGGVDEARGFRYVSECKQAIQTLSKIGEATNNNFVITDENGVAVEQA